MTHKTYKRELAGAMLIILFALVIAGIWFPQAGDAAQSIKFEVFSFAALAFGIDAYAKQVQR